MLNPTRIVGIEQVVSCQMPVASKCPSFRGLCPEGATDNWPLISRSVRVSIYLPDQPLVVLRCVQVVDNRRVVHRHLFDVRLMRAQDYPGAVAPRSLALFEFSERRARPDDWMSPSTAEPRDRCERTVAAKDIQQPFDRIDPDMRQIHRPDQCPCGRDRLDGFQAGP